MLLHARFPQNWQAAYWPLWVNYEQYTRFQHRRHREYARVNKENVIIDTIIAKTTKVIFGNKMIGKTLHLNEEKFQIFLQMRLEE